MDHFVTHPRFLDSNNFSIGIHSFKVLVQIHYSRSPPCTLEHFVPYSHQYRSSFDVISLIIAHFGHIITQKGDLRAILFYFLEII